MSKLTRPRIAQLAVLFWCAAQSARAGPANDGTGIAVELAPRWRETHQLRLGKNPGTGPPLIPVVRTWIEVPSQLKVVEVSGHTIERSPADAPWAPNGGEILAFETDRNDLSFTLKGTDRQGKTQSLVVHQKLAFRGPYFWLHSSCAERGIGIARKRKTRNDIRFLVIAALCEGEGEALQLTLIHSPDVQWGKGTLPGEVGQGPGWRRFNLNLKEDSPANSTVGTFTLRENRPRGALTSLNYVTFPSPESEYPALEFEYAKSMAGNFTPAQKELNQGQALESKGKRAEALAHYRQSRELDPELLEAWLKEIATLRKLGKPKEATEVAGQLATKRPDLKDLLLP